jgi:glycerol uptake facilitator-like aquaporin
LHSNLSNSAKDYIFAQVMGGLVGAAIVYGNYYHAIDIFEGGPGVRTLATAGFFSTYAVRANCPSLNNHPFERDFISSIICQT